MEQPRALRADAARNRERIVVAAAEVFATRGLAATLDDIADHAGVGVGTVYRRFADKEELIEAIFEERLQRHVTSVEQGLADPDPWAGLVGFLDRICAAMAADRGLRQIMLSTEFGRIQVARVRGEMVPRVAELMRRAQEAGHLRPGIAANDIPGLFTMISSIADFSDGVRPELWRRYLELLIDGLRATPGRGRLAVEALSDAEVSEVVNRGRH